GAEGMLARLAAASPPLADEVTVVSLRPAEAHADRLRAAGVEVVEFGFGRAYGAVSGLLCLAGLIRRARPDIVQGWMYHGDLVALLALALSGQRQRARLIWGIRCSDVELGQYGLSLRLVVKACTALS